MAIRIAAGNTALRLVGGAISREFLVNFPELMTAYVDGNLVRLVAGVIDELIPWPGILLAHVIFPT